MKKIILLIFGFSTFGLFTKCAEVPVFDPGQCQMCTHQCCNLIAPKNPNAPAYPVSTAGGDISVPMNRMIDSGELYEAQLIQGAKDVPIDIGLSSDRQTLIFSITKEIAVDYHPNLDAYIRLTVRWSNESKEFMIPVSFTDKLLLKEIAQTFLNSADSLSRHHVFTTTQEVYCN